MASITTRVTAGGGATVKGTPLSNAEIDVNFINLNTDKLDIANNLSDVVNKATARTNLGLAIGVNVQAYDAALTGFAGLVGTGVVIRSGDGTSAATFSPQITALGVGTAASATTGEIRATNQIVAFYSDERLKENIEIIPDALNKVMSLRGVTYTPNSVAESYGYTKEKMVGVIAQEVELVLPEAVKAAPFDIEQLEDGTEVSKSGENYKTVQYEKLVPLLIEAIKQLNDEVMKLKGVK
jgi:hypothetical protein